MWTNPGTDPCFGQGDNHLDATRDVAWPQDFWIFLLSNGHVEDLQVRKLGAFPIWFCPLQIIILLFGTIDSWHLYIHLSNLTVTSFSCFFNFEIFRNSLLQQGPSNLRCSGVLPLVVPVAPFHQLKHDEMRAWICLVLQSWVIFVSWLNPKHIRGPTSLVGMCPSFFFFWGGGKGIQDVSASHFLPHQGVRVLGFCLVGVGSLKEGCGNGNCPTQAFWMGKMAKNQSVWSFHLPKKPIGLTKKKSPLDLSQKKGHNLAKNPHSWSVVEPF